jgi:hypothetical protein
MNVQHKLAAGIFIAFSAISASAQTPTLQERLEALQESKTSDIRTPFLHAARKCIEMIEQGKAFEPGVLRARYNENVDLNQAYSRQRWTGANGLFGVRVGAMPGTGDDVVRTCALREGAGISDDQIDGIQADLVALMHEIVADGAFTKVEWTEDTDPPGRRAFTAASSTLNARGCSYMVKLDVTSRWADFSVSEDGDAPCDQSKAGGPSG